MTNPTYATDLTDDQWQLIKEWLPASKAGGRPRKVCLRAVFNALLYVLLYVLVGGASWRLLPLDYPHWRTAYWCAIMKQRFKPVSPSSAWL